MVRPNSCRDHASFYDMSRVKIRAYFCRFFSFCPTPITCPIILLRSEKLCDSKDEQTPNTLARRARGYDNQRKNQLAVR